MIKQKVRIGDLLVQEGLITNEQLMEALKKQQEFKQKGEFKKILMDHF